MYSMSPECSNPPPPTFAGVLNGQTKTLYHSVKPATPNKFAGDHDKMTKADPSSIHVNCISPLPHTDLLMTKQRFCGHSHSWRVTELHSLSIRNSAPTRLQECYDSSHGWHLLQYLSWSSAWETRSKLQGLNSRPNTTSRSVRPSRSTSTTLVS